MKGSNYNDHKFYVVNVLRDKISTEVRETAMLLLLRDTRNTNVIASKLNVYRARANSLSYLNASPELTQLRHFADKCKVLRKLYHSFENY